MSRSTKFRYHVGIDLGTTHTVVAYADCTDPHPPIYRFEIPQLVAPGEVAERPLLPSVRYHAAVGELAERDRALPWSEPSSSLASSTANPPVIIGEWARRLGAQVPGRLVVSAKSWLCHAGVDREAAILPWGGADDIPKVSPIEASASYLAYVRAAWNHRFLQHPLEKQDILLTVPASFDEAARLFTVAAARHAGLPTVRLLEEPLAACYASLYGQPADLQVAFGNSRLLLVCDVGGGTTDLTLIHIDWTLPIPRLKRIAVGNHLMLGGDNMDLLLAHQLEPRLKMDNALNAMQFAQLVQHCQAAKERLLAPNAPAVTTVTLLGSGARLIGQSHSASVTREEVYTWIVEGFLPRVALTERPHKRRSAMVEFGLPYAADAAISRHIAGFLADQAVVARTALGLEETDLPTPDSVLLNGGIFNSPILAHRLIELLNEWHAKPVHRVPNPDPEQAVARGAVAYGLARRGIGIPIHAGSARSYFLRLAAPDAQPQTVCVLARDTEAGHPVQLPDRTFALRVGQPVQFHLLSTTTATYQPGDVLQGADVASLQPLPPLTTVLTDVPETAEIPVHLTATFSEVGTLELHCVAVAEPARRWQVTLPLRGQGTLEPVAHPRWAEVCTTVQQFYGNRSKHIDPKHVKGLRMELERLLGKRETWEAPLLRGLFALLWDGVKRRRRSADHERVWLSLTGYSLRPGYGHPLDDWRVQQVFTIYEHGVQYGEPAVWSEWWTLWRRIAGGLTAAAQQRLYDDWHTELEALSASSKVAKTKSKRPFTEDDLVQLLASLEHLPTTCKVALGQWVIRRLQQKQAHREEAPAWWWALGRIGARVPLYGSAHQVVSREVVATWLAVVLEADWKKTPHAAWTAVALARCSGDRQRDLEAALRQALLHRLQAIKAPVSWQRQLTEVVELNAEEQRQAFGESVPPGLRLLEPAMMGTVTAHPFQ